MIFSIQIYDIRSKYADPCLGLCVVSAGLYIGFEAKVPNCSGFWSRWIFSNFLSCLACHTRLNMATKSRIKRPMSKIAPKIDRKTVSKLILWQFLFLIIIIILSDPELLMKKVTAQFSASLKEHFEPDFCSSFKCSSGLASFSVPPSWLMSVYFVSPVHAETQSESDADLNRL